MENSFAFGKGTKGHNSLELCCGRSVLGNMAGKKMYLFLKGKMQITLKNCEIGSMF